MSAALCVSTVSQQLKVAGDPVDLFGVVRPNRQTCVRGLTMEFSLAAVGDQMDFQPGIDRFVVVKDADASHPTTVSRIPESAVASSVIPLQVI